MCAKDGMSQEEAAKAAAEGGEGIVCQGRYPQHLSELGIKEEDLPRLAASAIADVRRAILVKTEEIILELYKKAF